MKLSKTLSVGVTVLASAALLAACGSNSSKESSSSKKTLNWTVASEIPTMDMSKATDATSFNQLSNTMEGLYRLGKNSKLEKALATSEKVSKDGKTYTYNPAQIQVERRQRTDCQGLRLLMAQNC